MMRLGDSWENGAGLVRGWLFGRLYDAAHGGWTTMTPGRCGNGFYGAPCGVACGAGCLRVSACVAPAATHAQLVTVACSRRSTCAAD